VDLPTERTELAMTLLENEVLERPDIDKIMQGVPSVAPERRSNAKLELAAAAPVPPPEPPGPKNFS